MKVVNKEPYLGVYKNNNPNGCFYHKLVDIVTLFDMIREEWGVINTLYDDGKLLAVFHNCDEGGIYISPRVLDVPVEKCHTAPYAIPLKTFLETHTKLQ